ncbi:MAG: hypothetical protein IJ176_04300 [Prevotella sp.]|nr:hypothetical protein [Prevotella sp.]
MKRFFYYCMSLLMLGTLSAQAQIVTDEGLDESFQFVDEQGNVVANGSTVVVSKINNQGQMIVPLYVQNKSGEKAAVSMYEDLSRKPNGGWQTCAFGNCMTLNGSGYSAKSIAAADYKADIQTEWMPVVGQYATWEARLQIHVFNIVTKTQFGRPVEQPGEEVIGYGPAITVRFVYDASSSMTAVNMGSYSSDKYLDVARDNAAYGLPNYVASATTVYMYQLLTADDLKMFDGAKVKQLRVAFTQDLDTKASVFLAPLVGGNISANVAEGAIDAPKTGWNTVDVDPYVIDVNSVDGLLLGFSYIQKNTNNGKYYYNECFPWSGYAPVGHGYTVFVKGLNNEQYGFNANYIYDFGEMNLSVQAIVEGDFSAENAAEALDYSSIIMRPGESKEGTIAIHNTGLNPITSLVYTVNVDGQAGEEKTVEIADEVCFNEYTTFDLTFNASSKEGTERRAVVITKVNDADNELAAAESAGYGLVTTTSRSVKKRVAVEELTGTGCPWCTRGIVGMELMRKTFPDDIVNIAVHQYNNSDAMFIEDYANIGLSSAPSCTIDRQLTVDPYYGSSQSTAFGIKNDLEAALQQQAMAGLEVKGEWADENTVKATATVESLINGESYDIEYVLVADSLSGTDSSWTQGNNYATRNDGGDLAIFCRGGKYGKTSVTGLKFNDVAIASSYSEGENQAEPIIAAPDDAAVESSFSLSLPSKLKSTITSENVWVVALLVNQWNGYIENAAKFKMPKYVDPSGIVSTESNAATTVAERYSLDGRQLPAAQKGLNIVRMSDGSVRKVVVK